MLLDFEIRTCSRACAKTEQALRPGDVYFSVLEVQEDDTVRHDYSAEAWDGPPETCLGWWQSRVPVKSDEKPRLAPSEVMLNLFVALADKPEDEQFRYLLGLLLIRRRIMRRVDAFRNGGDQEVLTLFAPRRDEQYELIVNEPDTAEAEQIQQRMIDLLYGDAEIPSTATDEN